MQKILLGIISVDFDDTDHLLIIHSAYVKYPKKKWECNEVVHQPFIVFQESL